MVALSCGTEARVEHVADIAVATTSVDDIPVWEEDDAIAGLRDYFISIAYYDDIRARFELGTLVETHEWQAEYTHGGWWLVTGPFLGLPPNEGHLEDFRAHGVCAGG